MNNRFLNTRRDWAAENDSHFGPFTWSHRKNDREFGIILDSGYDANPGCHLRVYLGKSTLLVELPAIIKPYRTHEFYPYALEDKPFYMEEYSREYGVLVSGSGFMQVFFGPQTYNSNKKKVWSCVLPWTQWKLYKESLCDLTGQVWWVRLTSNKEQSCRSLLHAKPYCPSVTFSFLDVDQEAIEARTVIEEREWRLLRFRPSRIKRVLSLDFSKKTGPRKKTWRGGNIADSIELLPGELHESAFRRYCSTHSMAYIGRVE